MELELRADASELVAAQLSRCYLLELARDTIDSAFLSVAAEGPEASVLTGDFTYGEVNGSGPPGTYL